MDIDFVLNRGVNEVLPSSEALKKLMEERKITLYQGFDPTADSLHIGHFIGLRKLSQFQKLGHKVIFLIGDFTALIGDPTDKKSARTRLTKEQIANNLESYKQQVSKIIDFEGDNAAEVKFNSEWLSSLTFEGTINLASNFTVQQMNERSMFQERNKSGKPIYLHEFLYPLMQGYDSVVMEVDLEIGGNDQLFNMMAGRTLLKSLKNKEKHVLTTKLLEDPSGWKMGKSEGNAVNLSDTPERIFGAIMAFPDSMLEVGFELLTDLDFSKFHDDPMLAKKTLAYEVVKQVKSEEEAHLGQEHFEKTFQAREPEYKPFEGRDNLVETVSVATGESKTHAKRLIDQGAVEINGDKATDFNVKPKKGDKIRIGSTVFIEVK